MRKYGENLENTNNNINDNDIQFSSLSLSSVTSSRRPDQQQYLLQAGMSSSSSSSSSPPPVATATKTPTNTTTSLSLSNSDSERPTILSTRPYPHPHSYMHPSATVTEKDVHAETTATGTEAGRENVCVMTTPTSTTPLLPRPGPGSGHGSPNVNGHGSHHGWESTASTAITHWHTALLRRLLPWRGTANTDDNDSNATNDRVSPHVQSNAQSFSSSSSASVSSRSSSPLSLSPSHSRSPSLTSSCSASTTVSIPSRGRHHHRWCNDALSLVLLALHLIGVLNMVGIMTIEPTPLLFMNALNFTSVSNIQPYITTRFLSLAMPVLANILLARLSEQYGPAYSLALGSGVAGAALLAATLVGRTKIWVWWLCFMMYSVSYALRVVRVGVICSVVPERERTNVLAKHALMTPLGAVFGPLVWIAAEMYRGSVWIDVFGARKRGTGGGKGEMDVMMMMKSMMMTGSNMTERLPPSTSSLNSVTLSSLSHYWRLQPQQQPESPIITTPSHHQERNSIRNPSLFLPHFHQHQHHSYGDVENDNYYSPSAAPAAAPPGVVVFDRFFLAYAAAAAVFFLISVVALRYLSRVGELAIDNGNGNGERTEEDRGHGGGMTARGKKQSWAMLTFDDGRSEWVDLTTYRRRTVVFFAALLLSVQLSAEFFQTAFEPAMVNVFHATDAQMGLLIDLTAILALIPPLLVSFLSRHLKDRSLLLIGLLLKLLGMLLYLPLPFSARHEMHQWQIVAGYLLIIKASIFFTTASMSLFSKTLGPVLTSHSLLGLLAAAQSLGPAVAQLLFASSVIAMFGSPRFAVLTVPVVMSIGVIVWPNTWTWLDPDSERSVLVRQATFDQQKKDNTPSSSPV